jgi:hypothetical protein
VGKRKKKQIGNCRLCGVHGPLALSHLIPRAVFDIIRSADPSQSAPIMMTDKITIMKHGQIKDYVLCQSCEQRFNENGEKYAVAMMHTPKGFKLLEGLERCPDKSFLIEGETAYPGAELGLDMDRLAYFAISVFWRAGVHRWPSKMTLNRTYSIELGDRCLAPMREFLMGAEFPDGIALRITAAKDVFSQGYAYFPAITVGIPVRSFGFLCCGILFELFICDPMMPPFDRFCSVEGGRRPIILRDLSAKTLHAAGRLHRMGRVAKNMQA